MTEPSGALEKRVRDEMARERAGHETLIAKHEESVAPIQKEYDKVGVAVSRSAKKDKGLSPAEEKVWNRWRQLGQQLRGVYAAITREKDALKVLDNDAEFERRLNTLRGRARPPRPPRNEGQLRIGQKAEGGTTTRRSRMASTTSNKVAAPDREKTIATVKQHLKDAKGDPNAAAETLNKKKVPTIRGAVGTWTGARVEYTVDPARMKPRANASSSSSKPAARKPAASKPKPAARKNGNGKTNGNGQAKPMPKAAQAAGTSRGGTGKKATTQAARTRTASRSGAARKPKAVSRKRK